MVYRDTNNEGLLITKITSENFFFFVPLSFDDSTNLTIGQDAKEVVGRNSTTILKPE